MKSTNLLYPIVSFFLLTFCPPETEAQKPIPIFEPGKNLGQNTE
jgi:hypothetical protein